MPYIFRRECRTIKKNVVASKEKIVLCLSKKKKKDVAYVTIYQIGQPARQSAKMLTEQRANPAKDD